MRRLQPDHNIYNIYLDHENILMKGERNHHYKI